MATQLRKTPQMQVQERDQVSWTYDKFLKTPRGVQREGDKGLDWLVKYIDAVRN